LNSSDRAAKGVLWVGVAALVVLATGCGNAVRSSGTSLPPPASSRRIAARSRCTNRLQSRLDYAWPVKPFHEQHPIRGNFGDPRTISTDVFGIDGLGLPGDYSFHNGVDISALAGTPVYPVVSGVAYRRTVDEVTVHAGNRSFQYWHLKPAVANDQQVLAGVTILGRVRFPAQHVHLTEIDYERVTNPARHLRPYADRTVPVVHALQFTDTSGHRIARDRLSGRVSIAAWADDRPPVPVPGAWNGFPVAPALIRWDLRDAHGAILIHGIAADFRKGEPIRKDFWTVYGAGTYQNFPVFDHHFFWRQAGRYLFLLTREPLDTRRLRNGVYTVRVAASDICGNSGALTETVEILNASGPPA
jgi:hypothetical protein